MFNVSALRIGGACLPAARILQRTPLNEGIWVGHQILNKPGLAFQAFPTFFSYPFPRANGALPPSRQEWLMSPTHQAKLSMQGQASSTRVEPTHQALDDSTPALRSVVHRGAPLRDLCCLPQAPQARDPVGPNKKKNSFIYMSVCLCTMCTSGVQGDQKRLLD